MKNAGGLYFPSHSLGRGKLCLQGTSPNTRQLLTQHRRTWGACGWSAMEDRQRRCQGWLCSCSFLLCVPTAMETVIARSRPVPYTLQRTDNLLVGAGTSSSASLMGQKQTSNATGCGEAQNGVWFGFPFSAGAVARATAVCRAEGLQLGVSCVLKLSSSFCTVAETVLAVVEIPLFEGIKTKAMV